jgi:hypothetical protein
MELYSDPGGGGTGKLGLPDINGGIGGVDLP